MSDSADRDAEVQAALEKYRKRRRQIELEEEAAEKAQRIVILDGDVSLDPDTESVVSNKSNLDTTSKESMPEHVSERQRRMAHLERIQQSLYGAGRKNTSADAVENKDVASDSDHESDHAALESVFPDRTKKQSLVDQIADLRKNHKLAEQSAEEKLREEESKLLAAIARRRQLASAAEIAQGVVYTEPMRTSWRPLPRHRAMSSADISARRHLWGIIVDGEDAPPPLLTFRAMRFPEPLLAYLATRNIATPSPIQMQGLPVALAGRDMIGIASTGTGKTLTFSLPLLMRALEAELRLPLVQGEGPIGLIVCPSRELARQTYEGLVAMSSALAESGEYPGLELRSILAIGGISMQEQAHTLSRGVHMLVATPGRLKDMLARRAINLDLCTYLCMDEADRMIDVGFEDDVRTIMSHFSHQRQTVLFSATMPKKIQDFARASLVKPVVVNVSRAGAANMDIIQEVEVVRPELRIAYLLECLQKTPPPV
ncbi:hypothetical protein LPJ73_006970, partial [Coemansia sp. RSA 2703]